MATRTIWLEGTANWAKVFEDNRDMKGYEGAYAEHDGGYTINVLLDSDNFKALTDAGSIKKGVVKDDGIDVKLLRKHKDRFEWASGAPKVLKADDTEWSFEDDGHIGNGSKVKVQVSVYDTSRPSIKGTRLEKVKVIDAVPYSGVSEEVPF